ncbi:MAG: ATP-dependent helicase [Sulfolobales archaeon]|nr:ATP-dependent helicase [Sulfolobales archaeon]MDW7969749.1 ATP-dependent helicase [Sulfolobales archaeon]
MVEIAVDVPEEGEVAKLLRPYTYSWFRNKYGSFTPAQLMSIPYVKSGRNVLISSPTGSGKTLAAFLAIIDDLFRLGELGELQDSIYALYVSPLRALNNDMRRNLSDPLEGIIEEAKAFGKDLPEVRLAVRTSDTLPNEKQRMLRKPPHILITTPESLAIALSAPKFKALMSGVRWVVVDEVHELASSKRGAHLSLTLERLHELVGHSFQRIGLSATISPLEEVAKFLVGYDDEGRSRDCVVIDARFVKPMRIEVVCPKVDIVKASAEELNTAIYEVLADVVERHRSTLIFTNTRSATERVVFKLKKLFEKNGIVDVDEVEAHHSSLSREVRLGVEEKLKKGELKCVVSSTSLELGIDIGYIDAVVLLSSPKSVTRLIQRVGRSGHNVKDECKGYLIAVDRDDLIEVTVLAKLAIERRLDNVRIPKKPLDVLAQHIVGMSLERKWGVDEAFKVVRRSYNYLNLTKEEFVNVLRYLAGRYEEELGGLNIYAKIWFDEFENVFGRKRGSRMIYHLNVGAIPDEAKVRVFMDSGKYVGDLEEGFVEYLEPGDVFVLGGKTYEFLRSEGMRVSVRRVENARPTVPSWFSEMLPLSFDSALKVAEFRGITYDLITRYGVEGAVKELSTAYGIPENLGRHIVNYIYEQSMYLAVVPNDKLYVIEVWNDLEGRATNVIFHYLLGRRVNDAISRAYGAVLSDLLGVNVRVTVTDNGFMLTVPINVGLTTSLVYELVRSVNSENIASILKKSLRNSELLKRRFRHCAERALALLRRYKGVDTSINRRQVSSETLLKVVSRLGSYPILEEAYREVLEDYMDIGNALNILKLIESGHIGVEVVEVPVPSPFAHNVVVHGYSDVVLMEDRRKLLIKLYDAVMRKLSERRSN